ncbi:MAG TPA: RICIN domain-containing protein [Bryobacteraceae bacterium]|nr:RICIN domain-containing protein [Bryobacteraceae bacterium]
MFRFSALSIIAGVAIAPVFAQVPAIRITRAVNAGELQRLTRNVHPLARAQFDRGRAPADLAMDRMLMVLSGSAEQQAELTSLLDAQQNPASPQYRQWLTPEEYGARFGPADADIQTITTWLGQQGFTVNRVSKGKTIVEFSGTAGQVQQAFHTEIHKYVVNGEEHWANASDPQIPAALAPVVVGVATMHNFLKKSLLTGSAQKFEATLDANGKPQFTSSTGTHALSPGDYWKIYNVQRPSASLGSTLAIVARSKINISDVQYFEQYFLNGSLVPNIVVNGPDPGDLGGGEEGEAVLDTSWAAATAFGSNIELIVSKTTNTTDGVDLSEEYIIDKNQATVMSESFGSCEANYTQAQAAFYSSLAQQAAAQGITYVVAAGDSGSSGCDLGSDTLSDGQLSVNLLAANPYVTAVGGTEFNENGNDAAYWASSNSSTTYANYISALSYIPEIAWNESCTSTGGANPCSSGTSPGLWAGGGGASQFNSKPSWQNGVPGIPNDGARDLPDISLTAAGHDPYLLCLDGSCTPNSLGRISFYGYAGTSAATPSFAGFIASINQQIRGRLGNINPFLYATAAKESVGSCNGSNNATPPAGNCVFNDVTVGNNSVPGEPGYNTVSGTYQTGVGYDLATGLGSVNEGNLAASISLPGGTPALTLSTRSLAFGNVNLGSSETLQATVTNTGTGLLLLSQFGLAGAGLEYSYTGCTSVVLPGLSCTLSFTFTPNVAGPASGFPVWVANTPSNPFYEMTLTGTGVGTPPSTPALPTLSSTAISFANQKIGTRSAAQTITIANSTGHAVSTSGISLTGSSPSDFSIGTSCGATLPSNASCAVYVVFTPAVSGSSTATVSISGIGNVFLTGSAALSGYFEIYNAGTGQVLDIPSGSSGNGTLIQQDAFNTDRQQRWTFIATGSGSYAIQNAATGKVLDVTGDSKSDGALIQQYDYLGGPNQQWLLTPIDDVHYAIVNVNSGKALDIPGGSRQDGTPVQQWDYLGNPQQMWVLLPATTYNITNDLSSLPLDVVAASTASGGQIEQAAPSGLRGQQWALVPTGSGYYAILNRLSGKVLDDTASSSSNGNPMQQYDYLGGTNQQWQVVPVDASNYKLINRQSGKALDDTGSSTSSGTLIQQWDYSGGTNQLWQLAPVMYYNIENSLSGLVLDVPGGSTSDGQVIQQWAANGSEQQEWEVVTKGSGQSLIVNNGTSKTLDVTGASTSNGAQIDQTTVSSAASQMWSLIPQGNNTYEIRNANSGKALDDTNSSLSNGNIMQQYDYIGFPNQRWTLVPAIP